MVDLLANSYNAPDPLEVVAPGTPLAATYPQGSAVERLLALPLVQGAIRSLVGPDPVFDHHFLHVTFPPAYYEAGGGENVSQHTHQIHDRSSQGFDLQIMYYPHKVQGDGGPGSSPARTCAG